MAITIVMQHLLYILFFYMAFSPVDEHNSDRLPIFQRQSSFKKKHFLKGSKNGMPGLSKEDTLLPCNIIPSSKTTTSSELGSKSADDNPAFGIAEAMGYTKDLITKAIHKLQSQSIFRFNVTELLDILFVLEAPNEDLGTTADDFKEESNNDNKFDDKHFQNSTKPEFAHQNLTTSHCKDEGLLDKRLEQLKIKPGSKSLEYKSSNAGLNLGEKKQPISLPIELPKHERNLTDEQKKKIQQLEAVRNRLRKDVYCNQCFGKKIALLFLPCRHMRACESCGNKMNTCDKCGKNVAATVKIYI